jgi:hypothetical protein
VTTRGRRPGDRGGRQAVVHCVLVPGRQTAGPPARPADGSSVEAVVVACRLTLDRHGSPGSTGRPQRASGAHACLELRPKRGKLCHARIDDLDLLLEQRGQRGASRSRQRAGDAARRGVPALGAWPWASGPRGASRRAGPWSFVRRPPRLCVHGRRWARACARCGSPGRMPRTVHYGLGGEHVRAHLVGRPSARHRRLRLRLLGRPRRRASLGARCGQGDSARQRAGEQCEPEFSQAGGR